MRVALGVQYDGAGFQGWQAQRSGARTVQACLERALAQVANHPVKLICAGRTDSGVHATAQVTHFDTDAVRSERAWTLGANANLPPDVTVFGKPVDFNELEALVRRHFQSDARSEVSA